MITQGKWEAELTAMGFCVLGGKHYSAIAERYFDRKPNKAELAELHSNAALIAAAPDLLEACKAGLDAMKQIAEALQENTSNNYSLADVDGPYAQTLADLEQAIAKAEKN